MTLVDYRPICDRNATISNYGVNVKRIIQTLELEVILCDIMTTFRVGITSLNV